MDTSAMTVFFDGGCALCRREISHYQSLKSSVPIQWIDITRDGSALEAYGLTYENALRRFHVRSVEGDLQVGAEGFICLWTVLPGYRFLARFLKATRMNPLLGALYERFAEWHYRRRCAQGACQVSMNPDHPG